MKRISIISIIILLALLLNVIMAVSEGLNYTSVKGIWEMNGYSNDHGLTLLDLEITKNKNVSLMETAYNTQIQEQVPYMEKVISTWVQLPWWLIVVRGLFGIAITIIIVRAVIAFVKLIISVYRQQIFTRLNAKRLRIFAYSLAFTFIVLDGVSYLEYFIARNQIELTNASIDISFGGGSLVSLLIYILFAEIFAVGVKLQEEQELTI